MVKHNQTIRRLLPTNFLSVFDHFVGLVLKGLKFRQGFECSSEMFLSMLLFILTSSHYKIMHQEIKLDRVLYIHQTQEMSSFRIFFLRH